MYHWKEMARIFFEDSSSENSRFIDVWFYQKKFEIVVLDLLISGLNSLLLAALLEIHNNFWSDAEG